MTENPTQKLAPVMAETFRYQIGEIVTHAVDHSRIADEIGLNEVAPYERIGITTKLQIVGRRIEECHGGIQLMYAVSGLQLRKDGGPVLSWFHEYELVPAPETVSLLRQLRDKGRGGAK